MDLPPSPIVEEFSRKEEKSKMLLTYFLKLPHVKDLQLALEMGLGIVRTVITSKKKNGLTTLPNV